MSGTRRFIQNKRPADQNIMRGRPRPLNEPNEFTLPPEAVRTFEERATLVAALEVFLAITQQGLKLPGRKIEHDSMLLPAAKTLLGRIS